MVKKIVPQTEEEWKQCRREGIGSSDVGTILDQNAYEKFHTWWEYRTGRLEEKKQTDAMVRGHLAEDFVANYFAYATGAKIIKASAKDIIYYDTEHPWRRATPDRFCWKEGYVKDANDMNCKYILECKTYRGNIINGDYPNCWYAQVMWQLGICGCDYAYLAWIDSSLTIDFVKIEFNKERFDVICSAIDSVWHNNILKDIEPPMETFDEVVRKFKKAVEGKSVELSNAKSNLLLELKEIKEKRKELDAREEEIKTEIALEMGDAEYAVDAAGVPLCTFKHSSKFNEEELKAKDPDTYNKFLVEQPKKFDLAAFKAASGSKLYKQYCTEVGARILRLK